VYFHINQAVENALITLPLPPTAIAFRRMMFKTIDDLDDSARDFVRDKILTYTLEEALPEKADDIDAAFIDHCSALIGRPPLKSHAQRMLAQARLVKEPDTKITKFQQRPRSTRTVYKKDGKIVRLRRSTDPVALTFNAHNL
jgi:hypothetical protein